MYRNYIGCKHVKALPAAMTADPHMIGYKVVYEDGYESWSPQAVFEASYKANGHMGFEHALHALKTGELVTRGAWLTPTHIHLKDGKLLVVYDGDLTDAMIFRPMTDDLLAEDWSVVEARELEAA